MRKRESPFWRTWYPKGTGVFIRQYLLEHGEAYPYQVFKALRRFLFPEGYPVKGFYVGSYQNIRNYFYWIQRLGLIEPSREEPSLKPFFKNRRYYRLTSKGLKTDPEALEWRSPRRALWPASWEKHH